MASITSYPQMRGSTNLFKLDRHEGTFQIRSGTLYRDNTQLRASSLMLLQTENLKSLYLIVNGGKGVQLIGHITKVIQVENEGNKSLNEKVVHTFRGQPYAISLKNPIVP